MSKLVLYLITVFSILSFSVACNRQQKSKSYLDSPGSTAGVISDNPAVKERIAMEMHEKLMTYFSPDWMERESDPDLYPDYYGGSFIDNSGTFVIAVTANREESRERLSKVLGSDDFKIEVVQYSYRQMMQVMDKIDEFLVNKSIPEDHPVMVHFAGAYPDVMINRVKVIFTEVNDQVINRFKKDISNSPLVVFEKGEMPSLM